MATETLSNITQDEIEYARMTTLIKSELDYRTGMFEAVEKGRKEERRNFIELLKQGLTTEEIIERLQQEEKTFKETQLGD